MNTRYTLTQETSCNPGINVVPFSSVSPSGEDRSVIPNRSSSSPVLPSYYSSPFLIRTAIRISRSRWFNFLRRVFHYQNGSRSDLGSNPFNAGSWMVMEFIALVVQIIITSYTLGVTKQEKPVWPMRIWISGYDFGCLLSLLMLYCRYRLFHVSPGDGFVTHSDIEQQRNNEESRCLQLMNKCKTPLDLFFAIWFVVGNVWMFDSRLGSFRGAPKLHMLCISLLAWNAIAYSFPFLLFVLLCCCVPLVSTLLGYNMNVGSTGRGASEDQISILPSWRYKEVDSNLELGKSVNQNPECCICLSSTEKRRKSRSCLVHMYFTSSAWINGSELYLAVLFVNKNWRGKTERKMPINREREREPCDFAQTPMYLL